MTNVLARLSLGRYFCMSILAAALIVQYSTAAFANERSQTLLQQQTLVKKAIMEAETYHDLSVNADWLAQSVLHQTTKVENMLRSTAVNQKMQKEIQDKVTPKVLINGFLKALAQAESKSKRQIDLRSILSPSQLSTTDAVGGAIAGTVTVEGQVPDQSFRIFAFDDHGYFAGQADVDESSGQYRITDLPEGAYYVVTWSHYYLDEIYPDQLASLGSMESWRDAQTVAVTSGITTPDINFDLQEGTIIAGELYHSDGSPIIDQDVTFVITRATSPSVLLTKDVHVQGKYYRIRIPGNGTYKISAQADGLLPEWYQEAANWSIATPILISAGMDSITSINFTLAPEEGGENFGSISGGVQGPGGLPTGLLVTVAVFDKQDTSLVGFGIGIGGFFGGAYTVDNLLPGDYFVYANDYTGSLLSSLGGGNFVGVFYPDALTIDAAQTVHVEAGQETPNVNLVLKAGGSIAGKVTGSEGEPLDSLLVFAFQVDRDYGDNDPSFTTLQFAFGETDGEGKYTLSGLPEGLYAVRTFSWLVMTSDLSIVPGKHFGQVVDEYYGDVQDILDVDNATPVPVTVLNTTENIDIQLDAAGFILGRVTAAEDGAPIDDIMILALNDTSAMPQLALSEIDSLGYYKLGPLPSGNYKAIAVSGFQTRHRHLTEFWDGVRTFQEAAVIEINAPYATENVNFTLDRGAVIQGFVNIDADGSVRAGADTLDGVPVIVYDAESGKVASYDFVQFAGGYRVDRLLPGAYKVMVVPAMAPFASTYAGGGATFDDLASNAIELVYGQVADVDVSLAAASGSISGHIVDKDTHLPISMAMVLAYEPSGHPAGVAMTDFNFVTSTVVSLDGSYKIEGLRSGTYFVRTFALSSLLPLVESLTGFADFDFMSLLSDAGDLLGLTNIQAYADKWYPDVTEPLLVTPNELVINLTSFGIPNERDQSLFPIYLPLPFSTEIPYSATAVQVVDGSDTPIDNIELEVGAIEDLVTTPVDDQPDLSSAPKDFSLSKNYPNPFNPSTKFNFSIPQNSSIELAIFDLLGQNVRTLQSGNVRAGNHVSGWDGNNDQGVGMPSGIYVVRLKTKNQILSQKITLIR